MNQCIEIGETFKSDQTVCEIQSCVKVVLKWNLVENVAKCLVQKNDTLKNMYCVVCAVY